MIEKEVAIKNMRFSRSKLLTQKSEIAPAADFPEAAPDILFAIPVFLALAALLVLRLL